MGSEKPFVSEYVPNGFAIRDRVWRSLRNHQFPVLFGSQHPQDHLDGLGLGCGGVHWGWVHENIKLALVVVERDLDPQIFPWLSYTHTPA